MYPVIRAIPTFGIYSRCYQRWTGYKPVNTKYSVRLDGMDGLDR
jgi:hypothetical protein